MANNRMWLINKRLDKKVLLAKFYPESGWYSSNEWTNENGQSILLEKLNSTLEDKASESSMYGITDWELKYEFFTKDGEKLIQG